MQSDLFRSKWVVRTALYHENTSIRTSKIPRSFRAYRRRAQKAR
ncbi:hypothetical protein C7S17_3173 [Burkholderia thailandensis]|nr:hypothetical protein [Burkholderia thailandensis]